MLNTISRTLKYGFLFILNTYYNLIVIVIVLAHYLWNKITSYSLLLVLYKCLFLITELSPYTQSKEGKNV